MKNRLRDIRDGIAVGAVIGGAIGTIFQGLTFAIPGGRELKIVRATAVIVPKVIRLSGTAVGTLVGATVGAHISKDGRNEVKTKKKSEANPKSEER